MFECVHKKIKTLAKVNFRIYIIAAVILFFEAFVNFANDDSEIGFILIGASIADVLFGYIASMFIYAIGEIVERLINIDNNTKPTKINNTKIIYSIEEILARIINIDNNTKQDNTNNKDADK